MANTITRTQPVDARSGTRNVIWIEGQKYSGTASGGGSSWIESTALSGTAEENVVETGTSHATTTTYYDGAGTRPIIYDAAQNFRTTTMKGMATVRTDTGAIVDRGIRGPYHDIRLRGSAFPASTGYEVHGFAKVTPANYLNAFQWNLIYIHTGTGKGQVRMIKTVVDDGTTVFLNTNSNFSVTPDNTSQFYICWSPLDVIYASIAGGWNAGNIHFDELNLLPLMTERTAELEIGNNGTPTYFGWANLYEFSIRRIPVSGWGGTYATKNAESIVFFGEADYGTSSDDTPTAYTPAIIGGDISQAWEGNVTFGSETGTDSRIAGGISFGGGGFGGSNSYALYAGNLSGKLWSYHNRKLTRVPSTTNSVGDYVRYSGGTWGGPFMIAGNTANSIIANIKGDRSNSGVVATNYGVGWLGVNQSGHTGDYFFELINTNINLLSYLDATGDICDWWYRNNDNYSGIWQLIEKKEVVLTVVDSKSKLPIEGVTITITNINGDIVSEADSGSVITADMTDVATTLTVDDSSPFTTGDLVRIDNEYITIGTIASGTSITGCTRESRYPTQFRKLAHKYSTSSFDPKIYIVKALTTDSSGEIPTQKLASFTLLTDDAATYKSQVTVGGVNYTCNTNHKAESANKPPNASYWDVSGTEGFPWVEKKKYSNGALGGISWTNHGPFLISIQKAGYKSNSKTFAPTIDTEATSLTIELERRRFIETKSREGM